MIVAYPTWFRVIREILAEIDQCVAYDSEKLEKILTEKLFKLYGMFIQHTSMSGTII